MTGTYRSKQREALNVYDPVSQETMKGLMLLGTSKLYVQSKLLVLVTSTLNEEDRHIQQAFDPVKDMQRSISWKKKFLVLCGIWAAIDWRRLSVGLSHPLAEAEAVLFGDPGNQPGKPYTPEEEPSPHQSVIVQLHPDLCFYGRIRFLSSEIYSERKYQRCRTKFFIPSKITSDQMVLLGMQNTRELSACRENFQWVQCRLDVSGLLHRLR